MKELTKYSRVAGHLEKLYDKLNEDFFGGTLVRPVITIQSTSRAYGHYSLSPIWTTEGRDARHEINIAAGTLSRPIEYVVATMVHEMVHQVNNEVLNIQDCSRGGTYHNKFFRRTAESTGLLDVSRSKTYGWSHTEPSDLLLSWILDNDIREIPMNRTDAGQVQIGGGRKTPSSGNASAGGTKSNSRRWVCPHCGTIVRSTRAVNLICGDCMEHMVERCVAG